MLKNIVKFVKKSQSDQMNKKREKKMLSKKKKEADSNARHGSFMKQIERKYK